MSNLFISQLKKLEGSHLHSCNHEELEIWGKLFVQIAAILVVNDYHNVHIDPLRLEQETWELYVDLSGLTQLSPPDVKSEISRDQAARKVSHVIEVIRNHLEGAGYKTRFTHLDLHNTGASLRAIWAADLIEEVCAIDLSHSSVSSKTFTHLHHSTNLRTIILDHCGSTGERFENLGCCKELETLSLVETNLCLPSDWLVQTGANCPKLKNIYISMGENQKILGLGDDVTLCTIINPLILGCGHLISEQVLGYLAQRRCPTCRAGIYRDPLKISPIIWIRKKDETWISEPVDMLRDPLDDKLLCHKMCGALYNEESLAQVYPDSWRGWTTVDKDVKWEICINCGFLFNKNVQTVYIGAKGGTAHMVGFLELGELDQYCMNSATFL